MKKFFIITNIDKDPELLVTEALTGYITEHGGICSRFVSSKSRWNERELSAVCAGGLDVDYILVLGGDGTLVRAARDLAPAGIPLIGVNLGTLGYLCELEQDNLYEAVDRLFEGKYEIEDRMLIEGRSRRESCDRRAFALNDIVIHRGMAAQLIKLKVNVNGEYLTTYSADGVIVSTPTGSTGYNLSAGGSIVDPRSEMIIITAINPHTAVAKSIVVGADAVIEVKLEARREDGEEEADVSFDGDHYIKLKAGESIRIYRANVNARILRLNRVSFLQTLSKKMQEKG